MVEGSLLNLPSLLSLARHSPSASNGTPILLGREKEREITGYLALNSMPPSLSPYLL